MVAGSEDRPRPPPRLSRPNWVSLKEAAALTGQTEQEILIDVQQRKLAAGKLLPVIEDGQLVLDARGRKVWGMHFPRMSFELYASQWKIARKG